VSNEAQFHVLGVGPGDVCLVVGDVESRAVGNSTSIGSIIALFGFPPSIGHGDNQWCIGGVEYFEGEFEHPGIAAHDVEASLCSNGHSCHHLSIQLSFTVSVIGNEGISGISENAVDGVGRETIGVFPVSDRSHSESLVTRSHGVNGLVGIWVGDVEIEWNTVQLLQGVWYVAQVVGGGSIGWCNWNSRTEEWNFGGWEFGNTSDQFDVFGQVSWDG